jgi:hypothetical protein
MFVEVFREPLMRNLENRLRKLEARNFEAIRRPDPGQHMADLIRDLRKRRLEASVQPVEERRRWSGFPTSGRRLSAAETLRLRRRERLEQRIDEKHLQAS